MAFSKLLTLVTLTIPIVSATKGFRLEYHRSRLPDPYFANGITPFTPLLNPYSSYICLAPDWFPWDYKELWNPIWSYKPMCVVSITAAERTKDNTYCTFVSKTFAENRGIAILTSVSHSEIIAARSAFTDPESIKGVNNLIDGKYGPPPYEKKLLPHRGTGIVANRTIYRGERIVQETPAIIIDRAISDTLTDANRIPMHWHMLYQLPQELRDEFLALHAQDKGDEFADLMRTNAFGWTYAVKDMHSNVFTRISRLNHDCRPNAHCYFNINTMTHYVHAATTIQPGEELSISYLEAEMLHEARIAATLGSWGFECSCSLCRQPQSHISASDLRISMIKKLKKEVNDWTVNVPNRSQMAVTLIQLYELERMYGGILAGYQAAAFAYAVEGNKYKTMEYAAKAVEWITVFHDSDSQLMMELKLLMLAPEEHKVWKWKIDPAAGKH